LTAWISARLRHLWLPGAVAAVAASVVGVLLLRLGFFGRAHSFDLLLYARGLWGWAHGDPWNPVVGIHNLGLHGHFLSVALAPLTLVLPAAAVLAAAQAVAFGATAALVVREASRSVAPPLLGLWLALVLLSSPLVLNPFLFDARPDLLGVPFATAALLRAGRRGGLDRLSLAALGVASLAREEFALVAVAAVLAAPGWSARRRLVAAAAFAAYFALYFFGVRRWFGGNDLSVAMHLTGTPGGDGRAAATPALGARLALLLAIAATAGGLPWLGGRWLLAALPGVLMLITTRWMVEEQIRFHYGMFAAPALAAAALQGFRRLSTLSRAPRAAAIAGATAIAAVAFLLGSSAPGGRYFARFNFDMADQQGGLRLNLAEHSPAGLAAHRMLARIPDHHGVAVPWQLAAPLADRAFVWPLERLRDHLSPKKALPSALQTVALHGPDTLAMGRALVFGYGFKLAGPPGGPIVLLTRDPAFQEVPWAALSAEPPAACARPAQAWPEAGLALCQLAVPADGPPRALVLRTAPAAETQAIHLLLARSVGEEAANPRPIGALWLLGGLGTVADLPVGRSIVLVGDGPLPTGQGEVRVMLTVPPARPLAR
jgi:uncharacterized membrane protein